MVGRHKDGLHAAGLLAVLLGASALRLYRLGAQSLWYDETVSVFLAGKALPELVAHTAGDIHPPGYYVLLHLWTGLAGSSDFAVAFPSVFFGLLLVVLAFRLGRRVYGPRVGLLAAVLVAISPYNLWYSQEVRMYTLGAALGLGLLDTVLSLLAYPEGRVRIALLGLYALLAALGLWTLYYFAFLLIALNMMVLLWWLAGWRQGRRSWSWLGGWALAQLGTLLLYAPWLPVAWRQATDPPVPPWRTLVDAGDVLVESWSALSLGQSVDPARAWPGLCVFVLFLVLGLAARTQPSRRWGPGLLAGYVFLPVLLIYLASFVTPLYHVRYVFTYSPPFYVLVGAGATWLGRRWRPLAWLSLGIIAVLSAGSIHAYHTDPRYASDDHQAAVEFLAESWRPGDAILVNAGYAYPALVTYWDGDPIAWRGRLLGKDTPDFGTLTGQGPVIVQTGTVDGDPSLGWADPASDFYAMQRDEVGRALEQLFGAFHRVWVYRIYDTVTDPQCFLRDWLAGHGIPFEDQVFGGESQLRVQGFLTRRDALEGIEQQHDQPAGDGTLVLVGSWVGADPQVGGALDLALVWRIAADPPEDALLFAGLFDGEGRRWAQADERPAGPLYPVGDWPVGARVRTPLRLQILPGTPPGSYSLEVGWYRFEAGQPVWLPWASGHRLALAPVTVLAPQQGWAALPSPDPAYEAGVDIGDVRLLGFDAPALQAQPGAPLPLALYWQSLQEAPSPGPAVLRLVDASGQVRAEQASAPAGGLAPFASLGQGQVIRDPWQLDVPPGLAPGVYDLQVGRRQADGTWLPVRRGPFSLGPYYPLATVRVLGR
jgi:mannosyltransferase